MESKQDYELHDTTASSIIEDNHPIDIYDEPDPGSFFTNTHYDSPHPYNQVFSTVLARMSVAKEAECYNMNHKSRGLAVILSHENFEHLKLNDSPREDVKRLTTLFKNRLGFDVKHYCDQNYENITQAIEAASEYDHEDCDCFVMVVLTLGDNAMLNAYDVPYDPCVLWERFAGDRCPALAGKPKLFFIQASPEDAKSKNRTETDHRKELSYRIPAYADFLVVYSTVPGSAEGSPYIQNLCEVLEKYALEYDLMTVLPQVLKRVDDETDFPDMPYSMSMLTRLVKFSHKLQDNHHEDSTIVNR